MMRGGGATLNAGQLMSRPVITVQQDASLEEVARIMLENRIGCVLVVDESGRLQGIVTETDFAGEERALPFSTYRVPQLFGEWVAKEGIEEIYEASRKLPVRQIMKSPVITAREDESITAVVERMLKHDINRIPVVRDGVPVGIIARYDLLRMLVQDGQDR